MRPTRPALRYHGGKWRLAPWIIEHFPAHRCYVEPYGGAGSVLLRKQRSYAEVFNELDGEITNLFQVLRDRRDDDELYPEWKRVEREANTDGSRKTEVLWLNPVATERGQGSLALMTPTDSAVSTEDKAS